MVHGDCLEISQIDLTNPANIDTYLNTCTNKVLGKN
jgi:hypothetical protein